MLEREKGKRTSFFETLVMVIFKLIGEASDFTNQSNVLVDDFLITE